MRLLHGGDRRERGLGDLLERLRLVVVAGQREVTTTERPSFETVLARSAAFSGLSMSPTPSMRSRRCTTSFTAAVTCASSELLPWIRTCSPTVSGKSAASMICIERLDSPLPISADGSSF
jgi:hypothetical protein